MTLRLWFLIVALVCAVVLVAIDLSWIDVEPNQHLSAWLGLSLAAYYASLLVRDR